MERRIAMVILFLAVVFLPCPSAAHTRYPRPGRKNEPCKQYSIGRNGERTLISSSSVSCSDCQKACIANSLCQEMYHPTLTSLLPAYAQGKAGRLQVLQDICQPKSEKCAIVKSMGSNPDGAAASCVWFAGRSNVNVSSVLAVSQSSCTTCLAEWLFRPEINNVLWAGLPPVTNKTEVINQYGGQLTGGDGVVTGAYIPQERAPAVAAELCGLVAEKVTALNMCPGTSSPPYKKKTTPPHRYYNPHGGRRLQGDWYYWWGGPIPHYDKILKETQVYATTVDDFLPSYVKFSCQKLIEYGDYPADYAGGMPSVASCTSYCIYIPGYSMEFNACNFVWSEGQLFYYVTGECTFWGRYDTANICTEI